MSDDNPDQNIGKATPQGAASALDPSLIPPTMNTTAPGASKQTGGLLGAISKLLAGPTLNDSEALAQLSMDMDRLGLSLTPKGPYKTDQQTAPPPAPPPPPPGPPLSMFDPAKTGLYGSNPIPYPLGGRTQGGLPTIAQAKLKYSGKLPKIGRDTFDSKETKALRDFSKNLNKRLPLESLLERYVDFLGTPNENNKVKHYTAHEIKKHLGVLIPEEALIVYDALVRDPQVDLNTVFYTLSSKFGSYKKADTIREKIESIMNDVTTPVLEVLGQFEILYNSVQGVPISSLQEEAMYSAMKYLKKRLGAGFAQQVKMSRIAYDVSTIRDLILMVTEEFSSVIEEGADKDLINKIKDNRLHSILSKASEVDEIHQNMKAMMDNFQPPPP